jgi:hypothetical protein
MNAAIKSSSKYLVAVHGSLAKTTFRVPPDVVLVFMTYPGACLIGTSWQRNGFSANEVLRGRAYYSATYLGGDVVSDYDVGTYNARLKTGVYAIPSMTRVHAFPRPMPVFGRSSTKLSALVATLMRKLPRSPNEPLVLFLGMCRVAYESESFKRAWNLDTWARARLGTPMPDDIHTTRQGTARHIANYTPNTPKEKAWLSWLHEIPPGKNYAGVVDHVASSMIPKPVTRAMHPAPKRALRPLLGL